MTQAKSRAHIAHNTTRRREHATICLIVAALLQQELLN